MSKKRIRPDSDDEDEPQKPRSKSKSKRPSQAEREESIVSITTDGEEDEQAEEDNAQRYGVKRVIKHYIGTKRKLTAGQKATPENANLPKHFDEETVQFFVKWEDDENTGDKWSKDVHDSWEPYDSFGTEVSAVVRYISQRQELIDHPNLEDYKPKVEKYNSKLAIRRAEPAKRAAARAAAEEEALSKKVAEAAAKKPPSKPKSAPVASSSKASRAKPSSKDKPLKKKPKASKPDSSDDEPLAAKKPVKKKSTSKTDKPAPTSDADVPLSKSVPLSRPKDLRSSHGELDNAPLRKLVSEDEASESDNRPIRKTLPPPPTAPAAVDDLDNFEFSSDDEDDGGIFDPSKIVPVRKPAPKPSTSVWNDTNFTPDTVEPIDVDSDNDSDDQPLAKTVPAEDRENTPRMCKKCKRAKCKGLRDPKLCDDEGFPRYKPSPRKILQEKTHSDDEPPDDLFDGEDSLLQADKFGSLAAPKYENQINFKGPNTQQFLIERLIGTRFMPNRQLNNTRYDEGIVEFFKIKEVLAQASLSEIFKGKKIRIQAPTHIITKASPNDDFSKDVAAIQLFCLRNEAEDCSFSVQDPDIVFVHLTAVDKAKDVRDLVRNPLFNKLRQRSGSRFFLFGSYTDRVGLPPQPCFKALWSLGHVLTFTPAAIASNVDAFSRTMKESSQYAPFIKYWLHLGLVVQGGRLHCASDLIDPPMLNAALAVQIAIGKANESKLVDIVRSATIPADRPTQIALATKAFTSFPSQADSVLTKELSEYKTYLSHFQGSDTDPSIFLKRLLELSETLRCKYLGINRWYVVGTVEERKAFEKEHLYETDSQPIEVIDFDDLNLLIANLSTQFI